ncbi:sigma factor-like helix-turn-helix DNA-binding protein [Kribbella italica]|uniref:sigma factor-like helix-turn-helix DNA-binding protein n=1 Tax=Kribbella italica TaxID=1540520 RepID=UPI003B588617
MAFLVVLESMTPAERVAFVLHDVFRYPFPEVAEIVGRTPAACRQLASSARRQRTSTTHQPPRTPCFRPTTSATTNPARGLLSAAGPPLDGGGGRRGRSSDAGIAYPIGSNPWTSIFVRFPSAGVVRGWRCRLWLPAGWWRTMSIS